MIQYRDRIEMLRCIIGVQQIKQFKKMPRFLLQIWLYFDQILFSMSKGSGFKVPTGKQCNNPWHVSFKGRIVCMWLDGHKKKQQQEGSFGFLHILPSWQFTSLRLFQSLFRLSFKH